MCEASEKRSKEMDRNQDRRRKHNARDTEDQKEKMQYSQQEDNRSSLVGHVLLCLEGKKLGSIQADQLVVRGCDDIDQEEYKS